MEYQQWWGGAARKRLPLDTIQKIEQLRASQKLDTRIEDFDKKSRLKVWLLYFTSLLCFLAYQVLPQSFLVNILLVLVLGLFSIPYVRVFMHSQMHWGLGGGKLTKFMLDHFISLIFAVPQTGYVFGHRAHHRYDNDYNPNGLPKDLQSTYIFSKNGQPTPLVPWLLFYVFIYQIFVHALLVFQNGKLKDKASYLMELTIIGVFHWLLYSVDSGLYLTVYLPGLMLAWTASGIVLYMMHAVDMDTYSVHPTNDSLSPFFNSFGDNDGYHLEHSLFPSLHPIHLEKAHSFFALPATQCSKRHYVLELFARKLKLNRNDLKNTQLADLKD